MHVLSVIKEQILTAMSHLKNIFIPFARYYVHTSIIAV